MQQRACVGIQGQRTIIIGQHIMACSHNLELLSYRPRMNLMETVQSILF